MTIWFLRLGVLYLLVGVGMGMHMAATHNFTLMPVHAHINLIGWVGSTLMWLVYRARPEIASNLLAKANFVLMHISLPVMAVSLAQLLKGNQAIEPVVALSSAGFALAALCFAINIWRSDAKAIAAATTSVIS